MNTGHNHPAFPQFRGLKDVWLSDLADEEFGTLELEIERSEGETSVPPQLLQQMQQTVENLGDLLLNSREAIRQTLAMAEEIPVVAVAQLYPIPAGAGETTVRSFVRQYMQGFLKTTLQTADWWCDYIHLSKAGILSVIWHDENSLNIEWSVSFENSKVISVVGRNV